MPFSSAAHVVGNAIGTPDLARGERQPAALASRRLRKDR
jgi:hypothetical protein